MRFLNFLRYGNLNNIFRGCVHHKRKLIYLASALLGVSGGFLLNRHQLTIPFPLKPMIAHADDGNRSHQKKRYMYNFIADAVEIVVPSVVNIVTSVRYGGGGYAVGSGGSGVVVSEDGILITNAHVVSNLSKNDAVKVNFPSGEQYDGFVICYDSSTDLAAIKLKTNTNVKFPVAKLGNSSGVRVGEWVAALGSPLGLSNTVTCGIVSSLHRNLRTQSNMNYIQTDAPINSGNSGGPLINLDGEVIGINCMTVQGASGISFAIPSDIVQEFLNRAKDTSISPKATANERYHLGVSLLTLTPSILLEMNTRNPGKRYLQNGVYVGRVRPRSPAAKAGLRQGDIIISVNNKEMKCSEDVFEEVQKGEMMEVKVQRGQDVFIMVQIQPEVASLH